MCVCVRVCACVCVCVRVCACVPADMVLFPIYLQVNLGKELVVVTSETCAITYHVWPVLLGQFTCCRLRSWCPGEPCSTRTLSSGPFSH